MEGSRGSAVREGEALSESWCKGPDGQIHGGGASPTRAWRVRLTESRAVGPWGGDAGWELMFKGDKFQFCNMTKSQIWRW